MIVPILERPDAEVAPSASRLQIVDWQDGTNPYEAAAKLLDPPRPYAISDSAWSMHLLGLTEQLPDSRYVWMTAHCGGGAARPAKHLPDDQIQQQQGHDGDRARASERTDHRWSRACAAFWMRTGRLTIASPTHGRRL